VLHMRFGDWQLFKSAILSLREWDGAMLNSDAQPSPAPSNNSASVSVPITSTEMKDSSPRSKAEVPVSRHSQGIICVWVCVCV
jgi:hypothetical protein